MGLVSAIGTMAQYSKKSFRVLNTQKAWFGIHVKHVVPSARSLQYHVKVPSLAIAANGSRTCHLIVSSRLNNNHTLYVRTSPYYASLVKLDAEIIKKLNVTKTISEKHEEHRFRVNQSPISVARFRSKSWRVMKERLKVKREFHH